MTADAKNAVERLRSDHAPPQVASLGRSIFDPIWREREHAGLHSEMVYVLGGMVDIVRRDGSVHGEAGDTLYTPAKALHRDVFAPNPPFEVYLVQFDWEGEAALLEQCPPASLAAVPGVVKTRVGAEFAQLHRDFQQQGPMVRELTSLRLLQIILMLAGAALGTTPVADVGSARRRQIMEQARQHIHLHYAKPLTLETIADTLHVSPYHLSHVFSAESGFTLSSYLTHVRMEQATQRLRIGRLGVAEVAREVGFHDPRYFGRVFKGHYGISPSVFRSRDRTQGTVK